MTVSLPEVLFDRFPTQGGVVGQITLNRPQVHNVLTVNMCRMIFDQLTAWASDPVVKAVIIRGAGNQAFCAGGDLRQVYDLGRENADKIFQFFYHEYRLNRLVYHFPKPYIAVLDGIVMGGGLGLSIHGSCRIATERLCLAMPETRIGFFPDASGTYFLPRCPYHIGYYLGLSSDSIGADEAYALGWVDAVVPHSEIDRLLVYMVDSGDWHIPASWNQSKEPLGVFKYLDLIDNYFSLDSIEALLEALTFDENSFARRVRSILLQRSPMSLKYTLEALMRGAHLDFDACMDMEYALCRRFLDSNDFYEGIRALLIDKDNKPCWMGH